MRRLDNVKVCITPYQLTPLHQVTSQVLSQMQSFNEAGAADETNGPTPTNDKHEPSADDELMQLEGIFKKLVSDGKISRKQLIQKLL